MLNSAIKAQLKSELARVDFLIGSTKKHLNETKDLPEGVMVCLNTTPRKIKYYFQPKDDPAKKRKYLGDPDEPIVQAMKRRRFYQVRLKILLNNKKVIERALKGLQDYSAEAIHRILPNAYKCLPDDCFTDDSLTDMKEWVKKTYKRNAYALPDNPNIACDGTATRSKGETIIYDNVYHTIIPFQYDSFHKFKGKSGTVHGISPDYLFKCKDGRPLAWEHFGLMGNGRYSDDNMVKLNKYIDCNFVLGDNLIVTSDNVDGNTDERVILEALEKVKRMVL